MANKRDVERARVQGMRDLLAVYKSCRVKDKQDDETVIQSLQRYISYNEWKCK